MEPAGARGAEHGSAEVLVSAEVVRTGVQRVVRERVRVRREVVTEDVVLTVRVRREVLVVEREEVAGAGAGGEVLDLDAGRASAAAEPFEVVLSEERPVVSLEVVPTERVRVGVRRVTGTAVVEVDAAREVVEVVPG